MKLAMLAIAGGLISPVLDAAVLYGRVLDASHRPVAGALIVLGKSSTTHSDADGHFRFENLAASTYSIHVEKTGFSNTSAGPLTLTSEESKNLEVTLSPAEPEFFDEPKFAVAGVTAGGYQGGHGSDVVLRSAESLAKATEELRTEPEPSHEEAEADRHHGLAVADENQGKFVEAAREFQRAAELDPSEPNLFDWGAELLQHQADAQAVEVFTRSAARYPGSVRTLIGLATAYYSLGTYDQAAKYFFAAADVNPRDPRPYLFLGQVQSSAIINTTGFLERMKRFAELHPDNAQAQFLYAKSLWEQRKSPDDTEPAVRARVLLKRAIQLDPQLGSAHLLLGIVNSDAMELERAIEVDPTLEEAHYRLAQIYRRTGQKAKAQKELALYDQLRKQSAEEAKQKRSQLHPFVFDLRQ